MSLLEKTRPLVDQIPGIVSFHLYPNSSKYVPEDIISVGLELVFENKKALNVFMNHPKHHEADTIFKKYLAEPIRMVLTHEI